MEQTKKKSFLLYQDQEEVVNSLTDAQAGQLFKAIFKYNGGENPQLDPILKIVFIPIRQALDRDKKKYQEVCQKNRENVIKRWHKKRDTKDTTVYDRIRSDTKHTDNDNDNDNDNDKREITVKRKKYSSLKDIGEEEIEQVANLYQVPLPFVVSCYDSLVNYCEAHGKRYKNYLAALRNFVKNDALKIRREVSEHVSKRGIDARNVK